MLKGTGNSFSRKLFIDNFFSFSTTRLSINTFIVSELSSSPTLTMCVVRVSDEPFPPFQEQTELLPSL